MGLVLRLLPGLPSEGGTHGTAATFDQARAEFEEAWRVFLSNRTEADFQEWRDPGLHRVEISHVGHRASAPDAPTITRLLQLVVENPAVATDEAVALFPTVVPSLPHVVGGAAASRRNSDQLN